MEFLRKIITSVFIFGILFYVGFLSILSVGAYVEKIFGESSTIGTIISLLLWLLIVVGAGWIVFRVIFEGHNRKVNDAPLPGLAVKKKHSLPENILFRAAIFFAILIILVLATSYFFPNY